MELPYYDTPDFTPVFIENSNASKLIDHRIGDFSFTDQDRNTVSQKDIKQLIEDVNVLVN